MAISHIDNGDTGSSARAILNAAIDIANNVGSLFIVAGPSVARTFTYPDANATILYNGGALGTPASGNLANCTFPTLNQNTSGSAAKLTTPREVYGNNFDGSADLAQIIGSAFGGTGNGFAKFTGPLTAEKTFTLPNADATLLYSGGALGTPSSGNLVNCTFPTLNQNTTGTAAALNTARAIYGNNFDGTAALTQIIASTYGGTGNGFTKFSGPSASEKTFTLPNSSASLAALDVASQALSGGAHVTVFDNGTKSSGTFTVDCGNCPLQKCVNGGAFTLAAPAADSSCMLMVTNNGSAGAITFFGFSVGSNTGDPLDTTNGHIFTISIWRINGVSGYRIAAHQ